MKKVFIMTMTLLCLFACSANRKDTAGADKFNYNVEQFADLGILRYQVPNWDKLTLNQKNLVYSLGQAALNGRDILFDQNNRYNLAVRRTLEAVYENYKGDKTSEDYAQFLVYLKRVWFSNGIHHHYGEEKFLPGFSKEFFADAVKSLDSSLVPAREGQTVDAFIAEITPVMFDPGTYAKKVNQDSSLDVIRASANNYYGEDITQKEVEEFYGAMKKPNDNTPVPYGLNSRLVKKNGKLVEEVYKVGGLYSPAIEKIVYWLEEASKYAENEQQKKAIDLLVEYYKTGDLKKYDEYSIAWVRDTNSLVDFINGFTEVYGDALGIKGSWESLVNFRDLDSEALTKILGGNAQWFEDNAPIDPRFKKTEVKGISFKTITAATLGGDTYPATPIGINLPNSNWIRKDVGSKSVTITNITEAYDKAAAGSGFNEEFVCCSAEKKLMEKYGAQTDNLHTDLHECLGHASGQLLPGIAKNSLKVYGSTIEEARADLFGLYYMGDPKMLELGLLKNSDAYKSEYYKYMMNGLLTQLSRIELGKDIEEAHMRNRSLIAHWALEHGAKDKIVELKKENGKTYVVVNDYVKLRGLFGQLLAEVQRITSEGDFDAAQNLVETYGVKVDLDIHKEIKARYDKLGIAPYKGFVNPVYSLEKDANGNITDIKVSYNEGYEEQMLRYSKDYSTLPTYND
ncbi:MAG: dipeptidyl peptidase 3 [Elusimicrobiota bacterium]|jgi:dipeptidyl-peptidase-3|nr:dipeptidyl peptidase 3 [Elusimicrobiota bacterium]